MISNAVMNIQCVIRKMYLKKNKRMLVLILLKL